MTNSTVFRSSTAGTPTRSPQKAGPVDNKATSDNVRIEAPYLDYEKSEKGELYLIEHYKITDSWRDDAPLAETIKSIHSFISNMIKVGKIDNSVDAVKVLLKQVEKSADLKEETRVMIKLEKINAYLEYKEATDKIEKEAQAETKKRFEDRPDIEHTKDSRPDLQKFDSKKGGKND